MTATYGLLKPPLFMVHFIPLIWYPSQTLIVVGIVLEPDLHVYDLSNDESKRCLGIIFPSASLLSKVITFLKSDIVKLNVRLW